MSEYLFSSSAMGYRCTPGRLWDAICSFPATAYRVAHNCSESARNRLWSGQDLNGICTAIRVAVYAFAQLFEYEDFPVYSDSFDGSRTASIVSYDVFAGLTNDCGDCGESRRGRVEGPQFLSLRNRSLGQGVLKSHHLIVRLTRIATSIAIRSSLVSSISISRDGNSNGATG